MKNIDERSYLNQYSVWGVRQHDPFNTDNIKTVNSMSRIDANKVYYPEPPKSRYLSPNAATYLT